MNAQSDLPIAVIGAGPIGLAAAAHIVARGETPIIFELTDSIAGTVRQWAHVRMFSPWEYNVDKAARELLEQTGWQMPPLAELPTGGDLVEQYLLPLSEIPQMKPHIHFGTTVTAVSRHRIDKMKDNGRDETPFIIQIERNGNIEHHLARAVIDASGNWFSPNPIGANGLFAPGESNNRDKIFYGIPDILDTHKSRYAHKTTAVIGGGHSAINAILELGDIQAEAADTKVIWVMRKAAVETAYGGLGSDALPGRGMLGTRIKELVDSGRVVVQTPFYTTRIAESGAGLSLIGDTLDGEQAIYADEIIATTGSRPDLSYLRELRLGLDPAVETTPTLAPMIDPNLHSCGTVRAHGEAELRHPEKDFYIVGVKSYGRAPTFLLATGHEQVRSVVAGLTGDWEAAKKVELDLPETGVCGVPESISLGSLGGGGCCEVPVPQTAVKAVIDLIPISAVTSLKEAADACCEPECCTTEPVAEKVELIELSATQPVIEKIPLATIATDGDACCGPDCC